MTDQNHNIVILGIDNALRNSGIALAALDGPADDVIYYGNITTDPGMLLHHRLDHIYTQLISLRLKYPFHHIVFEDTQYQNNMGTYKSLNMVQGVILLFCSRENIPYTILGPSQWRKRIKDTYGVTFGKKRKEQKQAAIEFVTNLLDEPEISSDEADAVCIALTGKELLKKQDITYF